MGLALDIIFVVLAIVFFGSYSLASFRVLLYGEISEPTSRLDKFALATIRFMQRQSLIPLTQFQVACLVPPILPFVLIFVILALSRIITALGGA